MSGDFTKQILSEKLAKLNSSQQSIQTLSNWCIFHRKRANQIVSVWEKNFHDAPKHRKLPLIYLANDILQNSRRKGPEFINEFWKTLPPALSYLVEHGDSSSKNASLRLIAIWEDRKVFGSFTENLREIVMGKKNPSNEKKSSEILTRPLEKLNSAFTAIQEIAAEEELSIKKSQSLISELQSIEADADARVASGEVNAVADDLTRQQGQLARTSTQLETCEKKRKNLLNLLKETLRMEESKLERVHNQIQLIQTHAENALNLRHRLLASKGEESSQQFLNETNNDINNNNNHHEHMNDDVNINDSADYNNHGNNEITKIKNDIENNNNILSMDDSNINNNNSQQEEDTRLYSPSLHSYSSPPVVNSSFPSYSSPPVMQTNDHASLDPRKRNEAAEVAAKLTASASSVAMLSSVLSSLAQESDHASASLGSVLGDLAVSTPPDKRQKLDELASSSSSLQSDTSNFLNIPSGNNHYIPQNDSQMSQNSYYASQNQPYSQSQNQSQNHNQNQIFAQVEITQPVFDAYANQPMANMAQPMMMPHQINTGMPPGFSMPPVFNPAFPAGNFYTSPLPPPPAPRPP